MCGIAGYWGNSRAGKPETIARKMGAAIARRGPDSSDEWCDREQGIAFAHRRLAVVDLTPAGHQPMISADGRYVLSYNGEIYNHLDIRAELNAQQNNLPWRGQSDTETLLAAISAWGFTETLGKLNGMFALALWDRAEEKLTLARDRLGEKPLYYGCQNGVFMFGSELGALRAHPLWNGGINRNALTLLLRHKFISTPHCIYQGIKKLPPAHLVEITNRGQSVSEPISYWSLEDIADHGQKSPLVGSPDELRDQLDVLLRDSVSRRMAADVPLGAFLSGGIDSSLVVALAQAQSNRPMRTFSIGFKEAQYNEAHYAKAVAAHLGTNHTELYVGPQNVLDVIPKLPLIWDEPFADPSQIPTYILSHLAQKSVTVSLSGDGGDELFAGYNRYRIAARFGGKLKNIPRPLRASISAILSVLSPRVVNGLAGHLPKAMRYPALGDRLLKLAAAINCSDTAELYRHLLSDFQHPEKVVIGASEPPTILNDGESWPETQTSSDRMMYLDSKMYLPDDILTKLDRASMAVGLEARVPLLDHRVVEFAFALPTAMKVRGGQSKWLLRQVLDKYVPRHLTERPKKGFGVPIEHWLRGPLRDWAEALLDPDRLRDQGHFKPDEVRKIWEEHQSGERRWHGKLWNVLMFQAWLEAARP